MLQSGWLKLSLTLNQIWKIQMHLKVQRSTTKAKQKTLTSSQGYLWPDWDGEVWDRNRCKWDPVGLGGTARAVTLRAQSRSPCVHSDTAAAAARARLMPFSLGWQWDPPDTCDWLCLREGEVRGREPVCEEMGLTLAKEEEVWRKWAWRRDDLKEDKSNLIL